jgi:hypothetical protein
LPLRSSWIFSGARDRGREAKQGKGVEVCVLKHPTPADSMCLYGCHLDTFGKELDHVSRVPEEAASRDTCERACCPGVHSSRLLGEKQRYNTH